MDDQNQAFTTKVYSALLDENLDWSHFDEQTLIEFAREVKETSTLAPRIIGKIADHIKTTPTAGIHGNKALLAFAKQVGIPYSTVRTWRYLERVRQKKQKT